MRAMTYEEARAKIVRERDDKGATAQVKYLGDGVLAMLELHTEWAEQVGAEMKTLKGCLDAIRKGAKGNVSDPVQSATAICGYYGIEAVDARRLALEVNAALMGGGKAEATEPPKAEARTPEPEYTENNDLDALLEGLF